MNCTAETLKMPVARHFSAQFQRLTSLDEAGQALAEASQALGWELAAFHADIADTTMPRTRDGDYIAHAMGWPKDYLDYWAKAGMGRSCPVGQRCLATRQAFFWNADPRHASWRGKALTREQQQVLDYYRILVAGGIAVPVRRADGKTGYVSWNARESRLDRQRDESRLSATVTLSHAFIHHAVQLAPSHAGVPRPEDLSERERECLGWAARGKTEQEIALILHRSAATIHFHLRNAITKLNACNRTHAVAIACSRGLIYAE